jgi:ribosome-associated translation inhibitor RaiA
MQIRTFVKGMDNKSTLRDWVEDKLESALDRFDDRIQAITVRLEDLTGPRKSGQDKRCSLNVKLKAPIGQLVIDERGDDIGATFQLALDRLKAAISRKAGKAKRGVGGG